MQLSHALNPRRIARSLVTILVLTLIQSLAAPVFVPEISTPAANAVSETFTATTYTSGTSFIVPIGVTSMQIDAVGGAGGKGGNDGNVGTSGTVAGYTSVVIAVNAGDVIGIFPGKKGADGADSAAGNGAGAGGGHTMAGGAFVIAGIYSINLDLSGGAGGNAGSSGSSGAGGGGGAASVVTVNERIAMVAGGAGGGGGAGNGTNYAQGFAGSSYVSNQYTNGGTGGNSGTSDGGGGGGGGGGYFGGAGGASVYRTSEYSGSAGSYGGNYIWQYVTSTRSNTQVAQTNDGYISYTFNYEPVTSCVTESQQVDIYTVLKVKQLTPCTWSVPSNVTTVDVFAVGGGGGGGGDGGGGGAGGSGLSRTAVPVTPNSTLNLRVGNGGAAGAWGWPIYDGRAGESSTISIPSGPLLFAAGGPGGTGGPGAAGGVDSVARKGQFNGGAGGAGSTCTGNGSPGKIGIRNTFDGYGVAYGGGGGGGSCPSTANTEAAGADGGGYGSYAVTSSANLPGGNGTDNYGGGGGGGTATGINYKMHGGRGGSGIILIRYATNPLDAFPASLSSALAGRYLPGDLQIRDSSRKGWIDSSGTNTPVSNANITATGLSITTQGTTDGANATGSSKSLLSVQGTTSSKITFQDLNTNYTLFHVARYKTNGATKRIFTAKDSNWLSGFYYGTTVAHHTQWLTPDRRSVDYKWHITTDQKITLRDNGVDVIANDDGYNAQAASATNFGINNYASTGDESDFQVSDVIIFNRELTLGEMRLMEAYLSRVYGLALSPYFNTTETDTAYLGTSTYSYMFQQTDSRNNLNDTFTVEAWVKPDSTCDNSVCTLFARENSVRLVDRNGKFGFILWGDGTWQWVNNVVPLPSGEWHHIAITKTLPGNFNDSVKVYLDGRLVYVKAGSPYREATTQVATPSASSSLNQVSTWSYIGVISGGTERWYGNIDEFKVWKTPRSESQIQSDMYSNSGADPNLQVYYNFNYVSGTHLNQFKVPNLAYYGHTRSDLYNWDADTISFSDVKTVATSGPYTSITFPRSYITQYGGWKVPSNISLVQAAVIGGGGGGGGGYQGGGGGAGGLIETLTTLVPGTIYPIIVGAGGNGHGNINPAASTPGTTFTAMPTNGDTSTAFGLAALGGGYGTSEFDSQTGVSTWQNINRLASSGGSGGGGGWGNGASNGAAGTPGQGNAGGNISLCCTAAGGGGAGGQGLDGTTTKGGDGGIGKFSSVLQKTVAAGGGGSMRTGSTIAAQGAGGSSIGGNSAYTNNAAVGATGGATNGAYGTGSGGGAGMSTNGSIPSFSGAGGAGVVALRYISALAPTYTKPSNVTLDVGQTETFTTNVAQDSATVGLTRTFKWESTTPTSSGVYTTVKIGTGAANAAFGWVPSDTSTTGSGFLYRLTVIDSDTSGLFISDSSTAWATINPAMVITKTASSNTLVKKINVSRTETYTITLGTPSYRATLTPVIQGITLDTSTAGVVVLKIGDTATVGTWLETLTVTDSVSASINFPLSITVADPPNLLNTSEIVKNGLILNLDAGNSQSLLLGDTTTATSAVWKDLSGNKKDALTGGATATTYDGRTCTAPNYYSSYGGYLQFNGTSDCFHTDDIGMSIDKSFTVEAWYRSTQTLSALGASIFTQNSAGNIGIVLGGATSVGTTDMRVGIFNGGWRNSATGYSPVTNVWNHYVGTYDGANFKLYVDGVLKDTTPYTGGLTSTINTTGYFIGRRWDGSAYLAGSIASLRVYNIPLSETSIVSNYNATKFRFKDAPATSLKPTIKYGNALFESFTATSGYDTKTVTLAVGTRSNLIWDNTSVPNRVDLTAWDQLNAGTYVETMTVTDSLGQSTFLPFTLKVNQADTLTVTMSGNVTTVYSGASVASPPTAGISGLAGSDAAAVQTIYKGAYVDSTLTCAQGGTCVVGNTGPGGGTVFYVGSTELTGASGVSMGGRYLEIAPADWNGGNDGSTRPKWAELFMSVPGLSSGIGAGAENTRIIKATLGNYATSANLALDLNYGGKSDWYMPSAAEMKVAYESLTAINNNSITSNTNFWVSEENPSNTDQGMYFWTGSPTGTGPYSKTLTLSLRPIRAFSPTYYSTVVPADVDTYTAKGAFINFSVGSLSNYLGIKYETSTLRVTQANQNKISINLYGANAGESFTVTVLGGSGPGAVSESVTAGGNASGCTVANHVLWNSNSRTEQKYCRIIVTKAASRNYFSDSITADVYFMVFVNSQPTNQVGGGSTIALNGMTTLETSTVTPPTITSIEWIQGYSYFCPGGLCFVPSHWELTGSGFGNADNTDTVVKFWRNKPVTAGAVNSGLWINSDSKIYFTTFPAGISTGRIVVITPNGEAVSDFTFTP